MSKLKKLPQIITSIALIFFLLYGIISNIDLNKLAVGIIIIGVIFYFIGLILKIAVMTVLTKEDETKVKEKSDDLKATDSTEDLNVKNSEDTDLHVNEESDGFEELDVNQINHVNDKNNV